MGKKTYSDFVEFLLNATKEEEPPGNILFGFQMNAEENFKVNKNESALVSLLNEIPLC